MYKRCLHISSLQESNQHCCHTGVLSKAASHLATLRVIAQQPCVILHNGGRILAIQLLQHLLISVLHLTLLANVCCGYS